MVRDANQQPETQRARLGGGEESFQAFSRGTSLPISLCTTNQVALQSLLFFFFWVLMEASLHSHDCLNPLANGIDSTSRFSPPQKSRGGTKNSSPLVTWLPLLATSSHPWIGSKSYLFWNVYRNWRWETKYYRIGIITQKIPRVYEVMSKEVWMMTRYLWEIAHISFPVWLTKFYLSYKSQHGR